MKKTAGIDADLVKEALTFLTSALTSIFFASLADGAQYSDRLLRLSLRLALQWPEPIKDDLRRFKLTRDTDAWVVHIFGNDPLSLVAASFPSPGRGRSIRLPLFVKILDYVEAEPRELDRLRRTIVEHLGRDPEVSDFLDDEPAPEVDRQASLPMKSRAHTRRPPPSRQMTKDAREMALAREIRTSVDKTGRSPHAALWRRNSAVRRPPYHALRLGGWLGGRDLDRRPPRGEKDEEGFVDAEDHRAQS